MAQAKPDPPVEKNGSCSNCGDERPPLAAKTGDPFCSANCCREWHQVTG